MEIRCLLPFWGAIIKAKILTFHKKAGGWHLFAVP
jgi:hypothetical protein